MSPNNLDLSGYSAVELDALVQRIVELRSGAQPATAADPPNPMLLTADPAWRLVLDPLTGNTNLMLRHHALGWVGFAIPPKERAHMVGMLTWHALMSAPATPAAAAGNNMH